MSGVTMTPKPADSGRPRVSRLEGGSPVLPPLAVVVDPCVNEERRLDTLAFGEHAWVGRDLLDFIDDGSTDRMESLLDETSNAAPTRIAWQSLARTGGKAKRVRTGMRWALDAGAAIVAYCDADLSTPLGEVERLVGIVEGGSSAVAPDSRVPSMGARIARRRVRALLGRLFARAASAGLGTRPYETPCGAKCLRASPALPACPKTPFLSGWAFAVELIGRPVAGGSRVPPLGLEASAEVPSHHGREVAGGRLTTAGMARAVLDLPGHRLDLRRCHHLESQAP
jgi:hypothetical protein